VPASTVDAALQRAWLRRGPWAVAMWPLSWLFGALVGLRKALYARGLCQPSPLPVPVIVVGNLIAGGAGKTPTVMAVVQALQAAGRIPAVISRGYGRASGAPAVFEVHADSPVVQTGDEPLLLRLRLQVPVFVGTDRVAAAQALLAAHPQVDVLVSDDGLQHLRLPRAVQVIVFDERGAGNGWMLPAGPLREPLTRRPPPRSVVLYNASRPTTPWPGHLATRGLAGLVDLAGWWRGEPPTMARLSALKAEGRPVIAAAGTSQPERFFGMLSAAGLAFTPLPLPDHHDYATLPWPADAQHVVVTEKDAVKLRPERCAAADAPPRIWVAPLDFRGDAAFDATWMALLN
jgi:tetraacyldisaccharide 4'-kinase